MSNYNLKYDDFLRVIVKKSWTIYYRIDSRDNYTLMAGDTSDVICCDIVDTTTKSSFEANKQSTSTLVQSMSETISLIKF